MMNPKNMTEIGCLKDCIGEIVTVLGWIDAIRSHGKVGFLVVRDGTGLAQGVIVKEEVSQGLWDSLESMTLECSVSLTGSVREEPRAPGGFEIGVIDLEMLGSSVDYPIQPKEHGVEFLLDHRHLWLRSSRQRAGLRVRHEVEQAVHDYFYEREFIRVDSPILTGAIGESAGSLFATDYFGQQAYLAQTGQLYVEAACPAFRKVYCFGPTFRAEKSKTRRHLTEFWMIEPEVAFADSEANMQLQEDFVRYIVKRTLERCQKQLEVLERDTRDLELVSEPFERISYTDAVNLLRKKGSPIEWGDDLGAPDEQQLTEEFGRPLFVYEYPKSVKAFYMKQNPDDDKTVLCNDLLVPGFGEIIGGSQREDDLELLLGRIREEKLPEEAYSWYLDLRRYGSFVHSGFGLGLERTVGWITGSHHIRELIPFPRMMNRLSP
ncbi:MAG: asparagine--tRNA ligase [Longimicrobiales bacterium]|nr:asparagine--tRNA ligase [Longimicrobiales bacterium]